MAEPFLSIRGVTMAFSGVKALDKVDFDIYPGEVHCLAGENGSGKSTMIKVISGVYQPSEGEIVMDGKSYSKLTPIEAIQNGVQVIYQDFSVFPNLTVMENLALTGEVSAGRKLVNWRKFRQIAEEAIAKIDFTVDLDARVGDLSVADKQLVAICRALLTDTKLLIMDEPTTALTHREVEALFKVVADLQARGIAILFVSHKLEEVFDIASHIVVMRNGGVVWHGEACNASIARLVQLMGGSVDALKAHGKQSSAGQRQVVARISGSFTARLGHDIEIGKGEIVGLAGLIGSGRTEIAECIFGLARYQQGEMIKNGRKVSVAHPADAVAQGIGLVPENRKEQGAVLPMGIDANMTMSRLGGVSRFGVIRHGDEQTLTQRLRE